MVDSNTGDFNSAFLLGGISVVVIGGLVYWFMNKSETEEKPVANYDDLVADTKNLIEDKHDRKRKNKKKKNEIDEEEVIKSQAKVQETPAVVAPKEEVTKPVEYTADTKKGKKKSAKVEQQEEIKPVAVTKSKSPEKKVEKVTNVNSNNNNKKQQEAQPVSKKERKQQRKEQLQEEEKNKQDDEAGWTVVDKKTKKAPNVNLKEEVQKAKEELKTYLNEF